MKIKILMLGESAKEVEVAEGATVEHIIQSSGFSREHMTVTVNGHPTVDMVPVRDDLSSFCPSETYSNSGATPLPCTKRQESI